MAGLQEAVRYHTQLGTTGTKEKAGKSESPFFTVTLEETLALGQIIV